MFINQKKYQFDYWTEPNLILQKFEGNDLKWRLNYLNLHII